MDAVPSPTRPLESLLLEALNKTPDGVCIFDPQDRIVYANPRFAALFCDQPETLAGKTFAQASRQAYQRKQGLNIETDDIDAWISYALTKRRQAPFRSFQTDSCDGRWLQLTEQLLEDGHMLAYFTDISAQKQAELQLQKLTDKLRIHAETDGLTQISNRRHFMKQALDELRRCRRNHQSSAMLAIDLDHFKRINDQYGHPGGDEVLIKSALLFKQALRPYDLLGRIGGEEFAVFIPGADLSMALLVAERLRLSIEQHPFEHLNQAIRATTSIGIAIDDPQLELDELFRLADQALYQAKRSGRNRVERHTSSQSPGSSG